MEPTSRSASGALWFAAVVTHDWTICSWARANTKRQTAQLERKATKKGSQTAVCDEFCASEPLHRCPSMIVLVRLFRHFGAIFGVIPYCRGR